MTPERYARIKALFVEAAELDPPQRETLLARECKDDRQLRNEVESLLAHDHSQTILSSQTTTIAELSQATVVDRASRSWSGRLAEFTNLTRHLSPQGHLAIGALVSCVVLTLLAYFSNLGVLQYQKELRREALNEIVDGKVMALRMWLDHETERIESWGRSNKLQSHVGELVQLASQSDDSLELLRDSPIHQQIQEELDSFAGHQVGFTIWDRRHILIADSFVDEDRIGDSATPWGAGILASVFEGNTRLHEFDKDRSISRLDPSAEVEPHTGAITPIRDAKGQPIAALLVHDDRSQEYGSQILRMLRLGQSGETYVFNREGLMLTESRFKDQLVTIGLLSDQPEASSVRSIYIRDPGGDLTAGFQMDEPLAAKPLTKMARLCTSGNDGDDLDGYRNYLGVEVVGAWRWIDDLEVGIATELDIDEADPGMRIVIWETWLIVALFAVCLAIALFSYFSVHRVRQQVGANQKLGQYVLEKQIGEGGMGKVFKARHELLKRPTAVKLLKPELIDQESIARFEREARLVSKLEHPNTIRVYDYGRTPEGLFYYVMEYIDGFSLSELVKLQSPLPPQRVTFLLNQICYSLREAHDAGLVHRDLKPGNIMACRHGGQFDVIKVLDFGLVKPIETPQSQQITSTHQVAGTPGYIAPERLNDAATNDPRSDIYAWGAVAYFLLTGNDYIQGDSLATILLQVIHAPPKRPSEQMEAEIPLELDDLVYRCLSKAPDDRPSSVQEIIDVLGAMELPQRWSPGDARLWWESTVPH